MKHKKPVYTNTIPSIADGLTVPTVGVNAFATGGNNFSLWKNTCLKNQYLPKSGLEW